MEEALFGPDFYPTPRAIARKMLAKISRDAVHFLEPSAGKGDLASAIVSEGNFDARWGSGNRFRVDVIEENPDLAAVLRTREGVSVVGYDWLTYSGVSYYDAIIMNPPFSNGATHLLRAWDFLHAGEIVSLINQETIDNPCTQERKRLASIIAEHGTVEPLGACFSKAERVTNVCVALVYLKKEAEDDRINLWHTDGKERPINNDDIGSPDMLPALRDKLGNMEHYYRQALEEMFKGFAHIRKSSLFMEALGTGIRKRSTEKQEAAIEQVLKMALVNVTAARAEFATQLRQGAWMHVFAQVEFRKWLDTKQTEELLRDLEMGSTVEFTSANIKGTLANIFMQRNKLFEQSVWNVFVGITKHFKGNTSGDVGSGDGRAGWKTNDAYKVNERLVFPYGCRYTYGSFDIWSAREAGILYTDLDRVLCMLDGSKLEDTITVCDALQMAFSKSKEPGTCESAFFHIRYFKKGTVHLKWKRTDLQDRFNITAAAGRNWIGEQTHRPHAD